MLIIGVPPAAIPGGLGFPDWADAPGAVAHAPPAGAGDVDGLVPDGHRPGPEAGLGEALSVEGDALERPDVVPLFEQGRDRPGPRELERDAVLVGLEHETGPA